VQQSPSPRQPLLPAAPDRNVCEYCDEHGAGASALVSYDAGNGTASLFHPGCHAEMMRAEICGGAETCDVEDPLGDHCSCFAEGLSCCGCKAVPS
jgi:hypothetical protein